MGNEKAGVSSGTILCRYIREKKACEEWEEVSQGMYLVTVIVQKNMVEGNLEGPH